VCAKHAGHQFTPKALREQRIDELRDYMLNQLASPAILRLQALLDSPDETVRLRAVNSILDRAGVTAITRTSTEATTKSLNVNVNATTEIDLSDPTSLDAQITALISSPNSLTPSLDPASTEDTEDIITLDPDDSLTLPPLTPDDPNLSASTRAYLAAQAITLPDPSLTPPDTEPLSQPPNVQQNPTPFPDDVDDPNSGAWRDIPPPPDPLHD